jgi:hypothetical protein
MRKAADLPREVFFFALPQKFTESQIFVFHKFRYLCLPKNGGSSFFAEIAGLEQG